MNIQQRMAELQAKDQALLDGLDPDTQEAVHRSMKAVAMAARMEDVLGVVSSYAEGVERATEYVYQDACTPTAQPA